MTRATRHSTGFFLVAMNLLLVPVAAAEEIDAATRFLLVGDYVLDEPGDLDSLKLFNNGYARWTTDGALREEYCATVDRCVYGFSGNWTVEDGKLVLRGDYITPDALFVFDFAVEEPTYPDGVPPTHPNQLVRLTLERQGSVTMLTKRFKICRDFRVECPPDTSCFESLVRDVYGIPTMTTKCERNRRRASS